MKTPSPRKITTGNDIYFLPVIAADLQALMNTLTRMQVRVRALAELNDGPLTLKLAEDFGSHVAAVEFMRATHKQIQTLSNGLLTHHWTRPLPEEKTALAHLLGGVK